MTPKEYVEQLIEQQEEYAKKHRKVADGYAAEAEHLAERGRHAQRRADESREKARVCDVQAGLLQEALAALLGKDLIG